MGTGRTGREKERLMKRKKLLFGIAITLVFSIILASRTFRDDQVGSCYIDDAQRQLWLGTQLVTSVKDAQWFKKLGSSVAKLLKTTGRTQLLPFYLPEVKKPKPRRRPRPRKRAGKQVRLRPESAHSHWRRVRREGVFIWPVDPAKFWVSSYFGPRVLKGRKGFHQGVDMAATHGTRVVAAADGYVKEAQYAPGYGNYILLVHPRGYKTRYAHLSRIRVKKGQRVRAGKLIGNVGATGKVTKSKWGKSAAHLHFEVYRNGKRVNPFRFLG